MSRPSLGFDDVIHALECAIDESASSVDPETANGGAPHLRGAPPLAGTSKARSAGRSRIAGVACSVR